MSLSPDDTSTRRVRRQPLWPWLLMPLVALAIFLGLRNVREQPRNPVLPDEPAETTASGGDAGAAQR